MSEERLQKLLARAGIASRRKAEELIREARVTVNGRAAEIGDKADLERDAVKVDGKRLQPHVGAHRYLLLNKPKYVVSTVADPEGRTTVIDLVPPRLRKALVPVGRLDYATEGLLLLTDDGDFAQQVAHPRYGCVKTYEVKVKGQPTEVELDRLRGGVVLDGKRTAPCRITPRPARRQRGVEIENTWWKVELGEGRSRQIREMFQRIGHSVQKLRRVAIGPVADPDLPLGMVRELTEREVELLRGAAQREARKAVHGKPPRAAGGKLPKTAARKPPKTAAGKPTKAPRARQRPQSAPKPARKPAPAAPRASQHRAKGGARPPRRPGSGRATPRPGPRAGRSRSRG